MAPVLELDKQTASFVRQLKDERKLEKALLVERVRGTGEGTDSLAVQLREGGAAMFDRTSTRSAPC